MKNNLFYSKASGLLRSKSVEVEKETAKIKILVFDNADIIADMVLNEGKYLYCPKEGIYIARYNVEGLVRGCICSDDTINGKLVSSCKKGNWNLSGQIFYREDLIKWLNTNNYIDSVNFPPRYRELWVDADDLYDDQGIPVITIAKLKEQVEQTEKP